MDAIRLNTIVQKDGEIAITGLPYKKGEQIEMILLARPARKAARRALTARQLRRSRLIGLWKNRRDIQDSAAYARQLRAEAQRRS
ncbi:MAG: hypothetical protein RMK99_17475 [Anaerolineales bacterium]|nr:hypothetical protein [Anaerolineales bacterium]